MGVVSSLCAGFPAAVLRTRRSVASRAGVLLLIWFGLFVGWTYHFGGRQALGSATLVPTFVSMVVVACGWAALALLVQSAVALQGQALRVERALADVREQRLARLRSQLAPHFICNALNAIAARVEEAPQTAQRMMSDLADLVRDALLDPGDSGTVREELARLEPYLALERARFEDHLALELRVDPDVLERDLPPLLLQPLVENAIRHGVAAPGCPLEVRLELSRGPGGELEARVTNPGHLGASNAPGQGVGVENVRRRLRELYPNQHELTLIEEQGHVVARLLLWSLPA
jgi:two-component system sensor histidine kinase AlgZ